MKNILKIQNICYQIKPYVDKNSFLIIDENLKNITRKKLVEIIKIINCQKDNFRITNNLDKYYKIITILYKGLESLELSSYNIEDIVMDIHNLSELDNLHNKKKQIILEYLPILNYCFTKNIGYKYTLQIEPIVSENNKTYRDLYVIKFLLRLMDDSLSFINSVYVSLAIYDYIFRNFSIVENNNKFAKVCYEKLIEFINYGYKYIKMKETIKEIGYDENTFEIWKSVFEEKKMV